MSGWAKRVALICVGLSVAGCAGSRSFTWRGAKARQRVRATYAPPVAPTYAPAGIESTIPAAEPYVVPATPRSGESSQPTPAPPAEPVPSPPPALPRQSLAPSSLPEEPAILFDEPLRDAIPLEAVPSHPKRMSDRPASAHQEQRSAVQELGEGPIASKGSRTDSTRLAERVSDGHSIVLPASHTYLLPGHSVRPIGIK